jgi:hypothetical protein
MTTTRTKKRYLRGAADHWRRAIRLQTERLGVGSPDSRIDLNFYLVAVTRLCEIAERAMNFPGSEDLRESLRAFRSRWPHLKRLRNEEEHFQGPSRADGGWYYFARDVMNPSGTYLLDVEEMEPHVESLYQAISDFLGEP